MYKIQREQVAINIADGFLSLKLWRYENKIAFRSLVSCGLSNIKVTNIKLVSAGFLNQIRAKQIYISGA